jgi:hypothetical protein
VRDLRQAIQELEWSQVSQDTLATMQSGIADQWWPGCLHRLDAKSHSKYERFWSWSLRRGRHHVKIAFSHLPCYTSRHFDSFGTSAPTNSSLSTNFNTCSIWRSASLWMLETAATIDTHLLALYIDCQWAVAICRRSTCSYRTSFTRRSKSFLSKLYVPKSDHFSLLWWMRWALVAGVLTCRLPTSPASLLIRAV